MKIIMKSAFLAAMVVSLSFGMLPSTSHAGRPIDLSKGQSVYVPAYSHIYSGNREQVFLLTVTLSIRNVDMRNAITVTKVDYFETQGKLLRTYVNQPVTLKPLESTRYIVPQKDEAGGSGANFIVVWQAEKEVNPPIIETIMIGAQNQQGISFTSRGQAIHVLP